MHKLQNKTKGFSLVELLIALTIGALLLAWGVPNYRDFKLRKQISDAANEVVYSMTLARAEAIRYGTNVRVSPTGTWQNGWTTTSIGIDGNPDVVIAIQGPIDPNLTLTQVGPLIGNLVFNNIGGLTGNNTGRFEIVNSTVTGFNRAVTISQVGSSKVVNL